MWMATWMAGICLFWLTILHLWGWAAFPGISAERVRIVRFVELVGVGIAHRQPDDKKRECAVPTLPAEKGAGIRSFFNRPNKP